MVLNDGLQPIMRSNSLASASPNSPDLLDASPLTLQPPHANGKCQFTIVPLNHLHIGKPNFRRQ